MLLSGTIKNIAYSMNIKSKTLIKMIKDILFSIA